MSLFDRVLLEWRARRAPFPAASPTLDPHVDIRDRWALETLAVARAERGRGEAPDPARPRRYLNNRGADVARYCAPHGDGWLWCAGFGLWCIGEAARRLQIPMLVTRSLGALQAGRNVAAVGRVVATWRELEPGDVMILKRPGGHHFTLIDQVEADRDHAHTIEGNHKPLVGDFIREPDKERVVLCASLRR